MAIQNPTLKIVELYVKTRDVGAHLLDLPADDLRLGGYLTDITRTGFITCIIEEAEMRFQSADRAWTQRNDEMFLAALDMLKHLAPQLHHSNVQPLLERRASNLGDRVRLAFAPWIDPIEEHPANYPAKAKEDTFTRVWVELLHRYRVAIFRLSDDKKKAELARDGAALEAVRASAQDLLTVCEEGTQICPSLQWLLKERPDFGVIPDPQDGSRLFFQQFRWHAVRWTIILTQIANQQGSVTRWSSVLEEGKRDHPEYASGLGASTILHLFQRYGFDMKTLLATPGEEDWRPSTNATEG